MKSKKRVFRISFISHGKLYELYAHHVGSSSMFGFIEVSDILFGEKSAVVLDPSEESLKREFKGVKCTYIPLHSVVRIDEVEKQGTAKVREIQGDAGAKVTPLPVPTPMDTSRN